MKKILILDNYDSFTYNLYQFIAENDAEVKVFMNDEIDIVGLLRESPTHIVISPGPGTPENPLDVGICGDVLKEFSGKVPILGVCLGHQLIVNFFGGRIIKAPIVVHGKTSKINHDGKGIFEGLKAEIEVMRYHSLIADKSRLPDCLDITAETNDDQLIMGIRHKELPICGVQFHPESIGTECGKQMLRNFVEG